MICLAKYRLILDKDTGYHYVQSQEHSICPICNSPELKVIGSRKRRALQDNGETLVLIIRRLRCRNCLRIHHELPDILVPYKRYTSTVIEAILDGAGAEVCCENSSIYRIKRWFAEISEYITGCLSAIAARLGLEIKGPAYRIKDLMGEMAGWLARTVRTIVNTNNWLHTRSAFLS